MQVQLTHALATTSTAPTVMQPAEDLNDKKVFFHNYHII